MELELRYPNTCCRVCGRTVPRREKVAWNSVWKSIVCLPCFAKTYPSVKLEQTYKARRRAKWRAKQQTPTRKPRRRSSTP